MATRGGTAAQRKPDADRIVALYASGLTIDEVAEVTDWSHGFVRRLLVDRGVKMRRRGPERGSRTGPPRDLELVGSAGTCGYAPPYPEHQYVSRDPCGFCGVKADIGCRHSPVIGSHSSGVVTLEASSFGFVGQINQPAQS